MARFSRPSRSVLMALATLFAITSTLYSVLWMYYVRQEPSARLGIDSNYAPVGRYIQVLRVETASPAERAGLEPGDRIVAFNERKLDTPVPYYDALARGRPGDRVTLDVERAGVSQPLQVSAVLEPRPKQPISRAQALGDQIIDFGTPTAGITLPCSFARPARSSASRRRPP